MNIARKPLFAMTIRIGGSKLRLRSNWKSVRVALVVVAVIAAPLVYVLSTGPVIYLATASGLDQYLWAGMAIELFYAPLILCMESSDFLTDLVEAYVELWEVH